ncbi:MAG: hypothetical protein K2N48_14490 [Muribaculaceae bacterium]|nr:hypothetical protein [Muribaculaceae bacterium]
MNRLFSAFTVVILGLLIVSCTGETVDYTEPIVTKPEPSEPCEPSVPTVDLTDELPEVISPSIASAPLSSIPYESIDGFNDFSWKFYLANSECSSKNVCVSPLSVGAVLGMIANGDDGPARNEILKTLGFEESEDGLNALNAYYQTLMSNLPNIEEGIKCDVTNTMWCDPFAFRIRQTFMQTITDSYYAYGIGINPGGENGQKAINEFVEKNTNGLIKNFLSSPLVISLAFLNTLYFKAGWSQGFEEYATSKRVFLNIDGKEKETDFMFRCDMMEYAETEDGTQAIRLNYGEKGQFSMTCVLPSSRINHIPLDEVLTTDNIRSINNGMKEEYVMMWLPKFEIESNNQKTIDVLKGLGMENICSGRYVFGRIAAAEDFSLVCFIHATKLKVDENGTEGAAVSLGGMDNAVGPGFEETSIHEVVFDRPFIFYIQENTTGAILFIGSVKTFS